MGNGLKKMISLVDQLEDARSEAQIELQDACSNLRRQVAAASPKVKRIERDMLVARNAMEKLRKCHVKYLKAKNLGLTSATAVNSMEVNDWCRDQNMRRFSLMLTGVLLKADVKLEELELANPTAKEVEYANVPSDLSTNQTAGILPCQIVLKPAKLVEEDQTEQNPDVIRVAHETKVEYADVPSALSTNQNEMVLVDDQLGMGPRTEQNPDVTGVAHETEVEYADVPSALSTNQIAGILPCQIVLKPAMLVEDDQTEQDSDVEVTGVAHKSEVEYANMSSDLSMDQNQMDLRPAMLVGENQIEQDLAVGGVAQKIKEVEASKPGLIVEMNRTGVGNFQTADVLKFKDPDLIKEESCSSLLQEAAPGCVALLRDSAEEHLDEGAVFPSIPLEMQQVVGTRPTSQVSAKPSITHKVNDHETLQNLFETTCPYKPTLDLKCSYHHQSMLISPDSDVSGTNLMEEVWTESEDPSSAEDEKPEPAKDFFDKSPTKTSANLAKKGGQIRGEVLNNLTVHSSADLEDYVQSSQDFVGRKEPEDHDKKSDAKEHCSKMSREDFLKYESEDSIGSNDEEAKEKLPDEYYSTTSKDDFLKIEEVFLMRQLDLKPPDFTFYYNQIDQSNFSSNQLPPTAADAEVAGRAQQERQLQVPASAVNCSSSTNQQQITTSGYNSCKNSAIGQKVLLQDPSQGSPQIAKTSSLQNLGETSLPQDVSQRSLPQNTSQRSLALNKKENLVLQKYEFGQETNSRKTDHSANTEAETKTTHNIVWKDIAKASTAKVIMKVKKKFDLSMNKEDKINHNFEWKDIAKASTSNVRYNTTANPLKRPNHVSDVVNNWRNKENYKSPSTENVLILPKEDQEQELQVQDQELADAASGCAALTSSLARKDLGYAIKAP